MKVYVVTRGCYSDQYVSGVFSSRELAQADIDMHGPNDTWNSAGDIQEYELDEYVGQIKRTRFSAEIDLITGDIFREREDGWFARPEEKSVEPSRSDLRGSPGMSDLSPSFGRLSAQVGSLLSRYHARKLAAEYRQHYLRTEAIGEKP